MRQEPKTPVRGKESKPEGISRDTATFTPYFWEAYNEIVQPRRFDHYLITRWVPELGPHGFLIVKLLRDKCYHNPDKKILRDSCEMRMEDLAMAIGVSRAFLFKLFKENDALNQFVRRIGQYRIKDGNPRQDVNRFQVCMDDPIHPADYEEYDRLRCEKEGERYQDGPIIKREPVESTTETQPLDTMAAESTPWTQASTTQTASESTSWTPNKIDLPFGDISKESHTAEAGIPPINPPRGKDADARTDSSQNCEKTSQNCDFTSRRGINEARTDTAPLTGHERPPDVWSSVLKILESQMLAGEINQPTWHGHLTKLTLLSMGPTDPAKPETDPVAVIGAVSAWSRDWVEKRHAKRLQAAFLAAGYGVELRFVAGGG